MHQHNPLRAPTKRGVLLVSACPLLRLFVTHRSGHRPNESDKERALLAHVLVRCHALLPPRTRRWIGRSPCRHSRGARSQLSINELLRLHGEVVTIIPEVAPHAQCIGEVLGYNCGREALKGDGPLVVDA